MHKHLTSVENGNTNSPPILRAGSPLSSGHTICKSLRTVFWSWSLKCFIQVIWLMTKVFINGFLYSFYFSPVFEGPSVLFCSGTSDLVGPPQRVKNIYVS